MRLVCTKCGQRYPVVGGIPRFVADVAAGPAQVQEAFDYEHRRFHDSEHTTFGPQLVDQFLANVDLPAEFFRGAPLRGHRLRLRPLDVRARGARRGASSAST